MLPAARAGLRAKALIPRVPEAVQGLRAAAGFPGLPDMGGLGGAAFPWGRLGAPGGSWNSERWVGREEPTLEILYS